MKTIGPITILTLFTLFTTPAFSATTDVECHSPKTVKGWRGTNTLAILTFYATVASDTLLKDLDISGPYSAEGIESKAAVRYNPTNPRYKDYNKFEALADAWFTYIPLLPKNLASQSGKFWGYLQIFNEGGGYRETVALKCEIK